LTRGRASFWGLEKEKRYLEFAYGICIKLVKNGKEQVEGREERRRFEKINACKLCAWMHLDECNICGKCLIFIDFFIDFFIPIYSDF